MISFSHFKVLTGFHAAIIIFASSAFGETGFTTYSTHDSVGKVLGVFESTRGFHGTRSWIEPGSRRIWSQDLGRFPNFLISQDPADTIDGSTITKSKATEFCKNKVHGFLPTADNYRDLLKYFEQDFFGRLTSQGQKDLYALFPAMENGVQGKLYWTSTIYPERAAGGSFCAYEFQSLDGVVDSGQLYCLNPLDNYTMNVQCVSER